VSGHPPSSPDEELESVVEEALARLGTRLVMGLPLGLGKPNRLANAFYRRAREDPRIDLDVVTALSLDPPTASSALERRFLEPFVRRHFGEGYPRLQYVDDLRTGSVPPNVRVTEFYLQSGSGLGNPLVQRRYVSSNYTHVARDLVDRGVNLVLQLVAPGPGPMSGDGPAPGQADGPGSLSLSCNPDLILEVEERLRRAGRPHMLVGQVHPELPFMHGDALVEPGFFHRVVTGDPRQPLFCVPRTPVSLRDHRLGLNASTLVADGGTLQIGIGALSDALVHALLLRHRENGAYRDLVEAGRGGASRVVEGLGGLEPFRQGLYGASEMFMDGFMHLYQAGILSRGVFDDLERQRAANEGADRVGVGDGHEAGPREGAVMDAAFFLGSRPFYDFLRSLDEEERPRFRMMSVERINQLYGGSEELEVLQRRRARFFNTCMMATVTGAAVSDGLEDHAVVSGVGGQYNFVAMAHAMKDGRSVLMMRSTRERRGRTTSNVVWEYPHATIPRHLRDLVVTEYGVADLRGRTDEECIQAMIGIADSRFQEELAARARAAGKLEPGWEVPARARENTPERIQGELARNGGGERFPAYPFGDDFEPVERRLLPALRRLERISRRPGRLLDALLRGRPARHPEELARMGLDRPAGIRDRALARVLAAMLD
jgi:acyl-CoA hydrolase